MYRKEGTVMRKMRVIYLCVAILWIAAANTGCYVFPSSPPATSTPSVSTTDNSTSLSTQGTETTTTTTQPITDTDATTSWREITLTGSHKIEVPLLAQKPEYPTGCESVSTIMVLRYHGESIRVSQFIDRHLPMNSRFYYEDGVRYGPSPYEYFIGHPTSEQSYGCMAPVIEKALIDYFGSSDRVINATGDSLPELCAQFIDQDLPVLVWVTIAMLETYTSATWLLEDGTTCEWPANEHCMVLVGYDERYYIFNDPYTGKTVKYRHALAEDRYASLGKQAIVITK